MWERAWDGNKLQRKTDGWPYPNKPAHSIFWLCLAGVLAACAPARPPATPTVAPTGLPATLTLTAPPATRTPTVTLTQTPASIPSVTASPGPTASPLPSLTPRPLPTPDAQARLRTVRLPILMYHYIEPWPADADIYRQSLTVKPEDFAAQMQYLHDNGYAVVDLYALAEALALGAPLPEKAVALTFDDGYRTLMDHAVPVMERFGFTGTVFVITEFADLDQPRYLNWPQLKALHAAGWDIEPHTKTHLELAGEPRDLQLYQMLGAIETIAANVGVRPRFMCYPAGRYDAVTLQLAEAMNLWGGVITVNGRRHGFGDRFAWTRVRVDGRYGLDNFIYAVTTNE
jgi:peptidoglycan/xylan/chitin deacetylase (PgdA/CDA1 family)